MTNLKPPSWMLLRGIKDRGSDPMLGYGTDHCWCPECGLYFNSTFAFDNHRVRNPGLPEKRCLSSADLRQRGWGQKTSGHWHTPSRGAGRGSIRARLTP